jgi:hypothetical protein
MDVGCVNTHSQQQAQAIYKDVALSAFNLFSTIKTRFKAPF